MSSYTPSKEHMKKKKRTRSKVTKQLAQYESELNVTGSPSGVRRLKNQRKKYGRKAADYARTKTNQIIRSKKIKRKK